MICNKTGATALILAAKRMVRPPSHRFNGNFFGRVSMCFAVAFVGLWCWPQKEVIANEQDNSTADPSLGAIDDIENIVFGHSVLVSVALTNISRAEFLQEYLRTFKTRHGEVASQRLVERLKEKSVAHKAILAAKSNIVDVSYEDRRRSHLAIARVLIEEGACDINRQNVLGRTPLIDTVLALESTYSSRAEPQECDQNLLFLEYLLSQGAEINTLDMDGKTALHHVAGFSHTCLGEMNGRVLNILIQHLHTQRQTLYDIEKRSQRSILMDAFEEHNNYEPLNIRHIKILLDNGADIHFKIENGETPLEYIQYHQKECAMELPSYYFRQAKFSKDSFINRYGPDIPSQNTQYKVVLGLLRETESESKHDGRTSKLS